MLTMKILGSSSKGNSYVIETDNGSIMLDCGVKNIVNKIELKEIKGILISHSHL